MAMFVSGSSTSTGSFGTVKGTKHAIFGSHPDMDDMWYRTLSLGGRPNSSTLATLGFDPGGTYKQGIDYNSGDVELSFWGDNGSTYVVDACNKFNGVVDWEKEDSFFRKHFHPKFIKQTTEKAYYDFFVKQDIKIDLLHIDADHTFDGIKKDFDLYSKIMNKGGIITIHDTDKKYIDNFVEIENHEGDDLSGPSEFVKTIDKRKFEVINFFNYKEKSEHPTSSGLTIVRKK